ncbi:putative Proteasome assembly chaperone 2, partial [Daphnia magna]
GKPFALLALKKLLLKAALGKLLLKIPLILLGGKAVILAKVLALKFALVTKGLIGLKAPLALLFLGG